MQTLFGFWVITNTTIVLLSNSNKCAGISSCLYMFGMNLGFYGLYALLNEQVNFFSSISIMWLLLSIPCGIAAFILYYWNKNNILSTILHSLPIGALISEMIAIVIYLCQNNTITFLDQMMMDVVGVVVFGILFYKKTNNKIIYIVSIILSTLFLNLVFF